MAKGLIRNLPSSRYLVTGLSGEVMRNRMAKCEAAAGGIIADFDVAQGGHAGLQIKLEWRNDAFCD